MEKEMMRVSTSSCLLLMYSMFALVASPCAALDSENAPSDEHFIKQLRNRHDGIKRLLVDYYMTSYLDADEQVDRVLSAWAPGKAFCDYMHFTKPTDEPWKDPGRFQVWLADEGASTAYKPFLRIARPADDGYLPYWDSPYLRSIGWHPEAKYFQQRSNELFWDGIFEEDDASDLEVVGARSETGGFECIEICSKNGSNRYFVSPELNYALVRKSVRKRNSDGDLAEIFLTSSDFRESTPGHWFPWQVDARICLTRTDSSQSIRSFQLKVTQLAANNAVADAIFKEPCTPGIMRLGADGRVVDVSPAGEELLEFWAAWCSRNTPPTAPRPVPTWPLACTLASVALLATAGVLRREDRVNSN